VFFDDTPLPSHGCLLHASLAIPTTRAIYHLTLIHFGHPPCAAHALLSLLPRARHVVLCAYAEPIFTFLSYKGVFTYLYKLLSSPFALEFAYSRMLPVRARATSALRYSSPSQQPSARMASARCLCPLVPVSRPLLLNSLPRQALIPCLLPCPNPLCHTVHQLNAYRISALHSRTSAEQPPGAPSHTLNYTHVQRTYCTRLPLLLDPAQLPTSLSPSTPRSTPLVQRVPFVFTLRGKSGGLRPSTTTAHAVHALVLGITLLTNAHTQIALRLLPSLPSTYWPPQPYLLSGHGGAERMSSGSAMGTTSISYGLHSCPPHKRVAQRLQCWRPPFLAP